MFTGIIEKTAAISQKTDAILSVQRPKLFDDLKIGGSIAVNGICLSVVQFDNTSISFDVMPETWKRTNLGDMHTGDYVNLERSLPAHGRFEGHIVQGHVEGTATVLSREEDGNSMILTLELNEELATYVIPKGSITVNGVSLTVVTAEGNSCTIALIPHTQEMTNLGDVQGGERVNIETDILGRTLLTYLSRRV
jgi:riboflavin synthase